MTKVRSIAAGAAICALVATGTAFAQGGPGGRRGGGPGGPLGFGGPALDLPLQQLNLTDAQQQQVKDIRNAHRAADQSLTANLRNALEAERKAVEANNDAMIRQVVTQQIAPLEADAAVERAHIRNEILAILTPDQQAQLEKIQASRDARFGQLQQRFQNRKGRQ